MSTANRCGNCGQILGTAVVGADGIARCVFCSGHSGWQAGPPPLQSVITWVPVSERLPKQWTDVLVHRYATDQEAFNRLSGERILIAYRGSSDNWLVSIGEFPLVGTVTHWAELPSPPVSEEGEG